MRAWSFIMLLGIVGSGLVPAFHLNGIKGFVWGAVAGLVAAIGGVGIARSTRKPSSK